MHPVGLEPLEPSERATVDHDLERAATGIGQRIIDHEIIPSVKRRNYLNNKLILTPSHESFPVTSGPVHHSQPLLTYLLTPWCRVLLEKLTGSAASQEIPRIFGTRRFITVPTSARHLSLS